MKRIVLPMTLILSLLAAGCAQNTTRTYPAGTAGTSMKVSQGQIVAIEAVTVEGHHSIVGTLGGAAVGASAGRTVGGGSGRQVAGAVGGVIGAVAGRAVERNATRQAAIEIIVKLDRGGVIAVIQEDDQTLRHGDRVRVLQGRRTSRVVPV
ncbi:MAG: glycine zipper 2TM domain-containing protein [Pseudomonadota bacterium]